MTEPSNITRDTSFSVTLDKEDFKFNCAHFIAYKGFRERLHGHNYRVGVSVSGQAIGSSGYLIDFGEIKKATRDICKSLNEYFICPTQSDVLRIGESGGNVCIECEDGASFSFPKTDCIMLPIIHSSAEELARYIYCLLIR
jgi:6-pyruvoyl-tetrahydropterin synthase